MEKLFMQMVEKAKGDKRLLKALKGMAVKAQQFELACNLREMETSLFPESEEVKKIKEQAKRTNLLLRMVDVQTNDAICWIVNEAIKIDTKKKGKFSMDDAHNLIQKRKEIFEEE